MSFSSDGLLRDLLWFAPTCRRRGNRPRAWTATRLCEN